MLAKAQTCERNPQEGCAPLLVHCKITHCRCCPLIPRAGFCCCHRERGVQVQGWEGVEEVLGNLWNFPGQRLSPGGGLSQSTLFCYSHRICSCPFSTTTRCFLSSPFFTFTPTSCPNLTQCPQADSGSLTYMLCAVCNILALTVHLNFT